MLRAVLDTNVIVSAIISTGRPRELLTNGVKGRFRLVTSDLILGELAQVFRQPRFKTGEDEIRRIVLNLIQSSEVVEVISDFRVVREDPDDDKILNTACDGHADIISTGDKLLLELKTFKGIRIQSVSETLEEL